MIAESNHYKVNIKAKVITVRSDVRSEHFLRREKALIRLVYKAIYKKLKKYYLRTSSYNSILYNLATVLDSSAKLDIYR